MIKVKTFSTPIKALQTARELTQLDEEVNRFIAGNKVTKVVSVSDTTTTDENGATIGLLRVVAYEA
ncbi:MAG: hypothetical protein Q8P44_03640 [Dehalococcoidia bacterium]|nr:hypothetical protein [Dehalococcoidia bacterium]